MKQLFWQNEWLNIKFKSLGVKLSCIRQPSSNFYSAFYAEVFRIYNSFSDLPMDWLEEKKETALGVSKIIGDIDRVLSIGCGLGAIEKFLVEANSSLEIDAFDFASTARKWVSDIDGIQPLESLEDSIQYRLIYSTQLLYAMSDNELVAFAKFISKHLKDNGRFLTVDTSLVPSENGVDITIKKFDSFKRFISLASVIYHLFSGKGVQLWGWNRDNIELISIFEKNGFSCTQKFSFAKQSFLVFKVIPE